ncbi:hypothetical protein [Gordonibacter sp.]|uniref:hypothetical protein n=1 Tax=Gordonibacter sp. TaxID=1968902 RepID=UPI0025C3986C|nr:hypothetical protein [Gordonibacter sp.]
MDSVVVGLNIKSAPFELLEKLSIHHSLNALCAQDLKATADLSAAVVLSTCNRLEFYATAEDSERGVEAVWDYFTSQGTTITARERAQLREHMYAYAGDMAVRHLFEVVCGLDSLIVGEAEILGQVSRAYKAACRANTTDKFLNVWFQRALHLGKKRATRRISTATRCRWGVLPWSWRWPNSAECRTSACSFWARAR